MPGGKAVYTETKHAELSTGVTLAFDHAGAGGVPLLLIHGWPETRRIWSRNIGPLARAGFEVIAPDLRGFGDSSLAKDGCYDPAAYATDLHRLVKGLGHKSCVAAGGDLGGVVMLDLGLRFPGFVEKQCFFNSNPPYVKPVLDAAGVQEEPPRNKRPSADYFLRQGHEPDMLMAELDTPDLRRRYVASFYTHRLWAGPGGFTLHDVAFHTEPFADADKLRASFGPYEVACGTKKPSAVPKLFEVHPVPALVLYGDADHVVASTFPAKCAATFADILGPFVVPGAGHFLQWERADLFDKALASFLR